MNGSGNNANEPDLAIVKFTLIVVTISTIVVTSPGTVLILNCVLDGIS